MSRRFLFSLPLFFVIFACGNNKTTGVVQSNQPNSVEREDPLVKSNAKIIQLENEEIELFIKRYGWDMEKTESGLYYQITKKNNGITPGIGSEVSLKYLMLLLSGDRIYSSQEDGLMTFIVEKSEAMPGLHEAVKLLKKGETARFVIPSHLAYGASGDMKQIGRYTPVAVIVELVEVK